jgi:hypothetical protein
VDVIDKLKLRFYDSGDPIFKEAWEELEMLRNATLSPLRKQIERAVEEIDQIIESEKEFSDQSYFDLGVQTGLEIANQTIRSNLYGSILYEDEPN